jgi:hypothetical protein
MPIVPINEPVGISQSLTLLVYRVEGLSIVANHLVDSFGGYLYAGYTYDHPYTSCS